MKIGVLTFHRADNYGALLQCYALCRVLGALGHEVVVVDYRQPYIELQYIPFSFRYFMTLCLSAPRAIPKYLLSIGERRTMHPRFSAFRNERFELADLGAQDIDMYVIGSDQLWSRHCTGGVDPVYYGAFARAAHSRVISYAISSNTDSISSLSADVLSGYLRNFESLSFRESEISKMICERCGVESRVDIDPTLLLDASAWEQIVEERYSERRYVLLYQLRTKGGVGNRLRDKALALARELKCEVVDLSSGGYTIEEFVSLFRYAQYVVTSSFHGTAFALIFRRGLYSVKLGDGHDGRCENLLREVGGEGMLVDIDFAPVVQHVDYDAISERLQMLRNNSIDHLRMLQRED